MHQSLKGAPWVGPTLQFSVSGIWWASLSIVQLPMLACEGREAIVTAPPSTRDSAVSPCFHGCLAFLHRHFPPQSPPSHPLDHSQQQPSPWDCSTTPKLQLPSRCTFRGIYIPLQGMCGCAKDCLILIPFRLPQISCFILSFKCFSSDSDNCPNVGIGSLLQFPHLPRAGPVLLTLLFFPLVPSSYQVLHGSTYSFPLVRSSCPLPAGVLCLKVCSWCIRGQRHTPRPPTPLPSCSLWSTFCVP